MTTLSDGSATRPWLRTRFALAIVLLLFGVTAAARYRECTDTESLRADDSVVVLTTCTPPTVTSAGVLLLLLLVAALLWPDISEITVLGVSLKRKVAQAQVAAETARERIEQLREVVQFQQTQIEAVTTATATNTTNIHFGDGALREDQRERLRRQAEEVRAESPKDQDPDAEQPSSKASDGELKLQVLSEFQTLSDLLGLSTERGRGRLVSKDHRRRAVQQFFLEDHAGPVRSVRAVRNAVAHAQPVSREDLENALVVLSDLIPAAHEHFLNHDIPLEE